MKIKRDDLVVVISGVHKPAKAEGAEPHKVIQVLDGGRKLLVEGINRAKKHVRRGHPKSPQGGRLEMELPIDASNVALFCPSCNRGTKAGYRYADDGAKERFCRKCGGSQGQISPPNAKYARS